MTLQNDIRPSRVLVVEDEMLVALHVADMLSAAGCEVIGPALRVSDGVALVEGGEAPAFALLDINLGGEMSWPVARALVLRGIPFVFITGYVGEHAELPADLAGTCLLSKPLAEDDLRRAIAPWRTPAACAAAVSP